MGARLGVSRLTEITRLDRVGIPVYSSVRPAALEGSLCVNAGKGVSRLDAAVGACMEAIEYAVAEPGVSEVPVVMRTARDVLDGRVRPSAILDFCPIVQSQFDLGAPLACVEMEDIVSGLSVLAPAELVFLPYVRRPGVGKFGSNSNGLASGNTLEEATLHGLLEVIERDARSFQSIREDARLVTAASLPSVARGLIAQIEAANLRICVKSLPNEFDVPCFQAAIMDPLARNALLLNGGYGAHLSAQIAVVRAITEAVQSRLSWIHGARDDLLQAEESFGNPVEADLVRRAAERFSKLEADPDPIAFEEVRGNSETSTSVGAALDEAIERLTDRGIHHVCRLELTDVSSPLKVARVIVPRLEQLNRFSHRVGPRLYALIRHGHV
jgi:ribosomal protein S12 methylthiotransferase accessory factor